MVFVHGGQEIASPFTAGDLPDLPRYRLAEGVAGILVQFERRKGPALLHPQQARQATVFFLRGALAGRAEPQQLAEPLFGAVVLPMPVVAFQPCGRGLMEALLQAIARPADLEVDVYLRPHLRAEGQHVVHGLAGEVVAIEQRGLQRLQERRFAFFVVADDDGQPRFQAVDRHPGKVFAEVPHGDAPDQHDAPSMRTCS